jgi:hypothetical protein
VFILLRVKYECGSVAGVLKRVVLTFPISWSENDSSLEVIILGEITVMKQVVVFLVMFAVSIFFEITCLAAIIHVPGDQPTIQAGIDAALVGDTVIVADGTYNGDGNRDISFNGKVITVMSENGPESCVIDCDGSEQENHRGFNFHQSENSDSVVKGFTVVNGFVSGFGSEGWGGGVSCNSSSPTIIDCKIMNNTALGGAGIYCFNNSSSRIENCMISNNQSSGIGCNNATPYIANCIIRNNFSSSAGAGINCADSAPEIFNCTVTSNSSDYLGAGLYCLESSPNILNCIFWNNVPDEIWESESNLTITYSCIQGGASGTGNIDMDPLFVTGPLGEFYLSQINAGQSENSPCVDSGSDLAENICFEIPEGVICMNGLTTRTDEITDSGQVDMGYHYVSSLPTPTPACVNHGDVNLSGDITAADAQLAFFIVLGLYSPTYEEACAADCNGSDEVTAADAQAIFLTVLGSGVCVDPL